MNETELCPEAAILQTLQPVDSHMHINILYSPVRPEAKEQEPRRLQEEHVRPRRPRLLGYVRFLLLRRKSKFPRLPSRSLFGAWMVAQSNVHQ